MATTTFIQFYTENTSGKGEAPGKLELVETELADAREFAEQAFAKKGTGLDAEIPEFDQNYETVREEAALGRTQRKEMPVITNEDVRKFQSRLERGFIDISKPFAEDTDPGKPFPEGLSGFNAARWLTAGLRDNSKEDDMVPVSIRDVPLRELHPIQRQIYADKSIGATAQFGVQGTIDFLKHKSFFIISADNYIIDGHHRWLSGNLIEPDMEVNALSIDLPINKLLPMSKAYGDAIGNPRNQ